MNTIDDIQDDYHLTHEPQYKYVSNISSIDESHDSYITKYNNSNAQLITKKQKMQKIQKSIESLKISNPNYLKLKTQLSTEYNLLKSEVDNIEAKTDLTDYLLKVGKTIIDYYNVDYHNSQHSTEIVDIATIATESNNLENDITDLELKRLSTSIRKIKKIPKKRNVDLMQPITSILDYFSSDSLLLDTKYTSDVQDKSTLNNNYLTILNKQQFSNLINKSDKFSCISCNCEKFFHTDGYYICPNCGDSEHIFIDSELLNIKDSSNNAQKYPYKRLNHFKEKLNQFQGKENFDIPDKVKQTIYLQLQLLDIDKSQITKKQIDKILHEFKFQRCYEHLTYIYCEITKKKSVEISKDIEDKLCSLFMQMQGSHDKHTPSSRSNSVNYSYIINKLLIIIGEYELAQYFPLLKNKEKLCNLDKIWEKICVDMDWIFESSF
jgi:hypothetical protein